MHGLFDVCMTPMIDSILGAIMLPDAVHRELQSPGLFMMIRSAQLQTLVPMCMIANGESGGQATFGVHTGQMRDMWTSTTALLHGGAEYLVNLGLRMRSIGQF
jgi:hypothetical protein